MRTPMAHITIECRVAGTLLLLQECGMDGRFHAQG